MEKIVIAPDSFKGTLSSIEVCQIISRAFLTVFPALQIRSIPVADGGEGTVDAFLSALGGSRIIVRTYDPYFNEINASMGILPDLKTAVIEMAAASGLPLVGDRRNPLETSSYGTGLLISAALDQGCTKIILGIGGSATNDGGIGMASALGVRFLDEMLQEIPLNAAGLGKLRSIDRSGLDKRLNQCFITVACDVDNTLCGPQGASYIFGPQKGATLEMLPILDRNLYNYAEILNNEFGISIREIPGTGAAGGIGASLLAFTRCEMKSGINIMLETVDFDSIIHDADLIITGEGKIDGQSLHGKVPIGIAERALKSRIPMLAIVGSIGDGLENVYDRGISAIFTTCQRTGSFEDIKLTCRADLYFTAENIARLIKNSKTCKN